MLWVSLNVLYSVLNVRNASDWIWKKNGYLRFNVTFSLIKCMEARQEHFNVECTASRYIWYYKVVHYFFNIKTNNLGFWLDRKQKVSKNKYFFHFSNSLARLFGGLNINNK